MDNIILQKTWVQGCPVIVDNLLGTAFTGEAQAHTFVVSGVDAAQEPVTITGTITGKFLAANNVTVPLTGSLVNGAASVTLTDECYDVPGRYILSIYATNGSTTQCLYCAVGNVFRTDSQTIAYPSTDLPNITTLMAQLEEILDGWPADYSQLQSDVSNLKSAIGLDAIQITERNKYINMTGSTADPASPSSSSTGFCYSLVACKEGDQFIVNAVGGGNPRAWGFLGAVTTGTTRTVLCVADANYTASNLLLTAPKNAEYFVINDNSGSISYKGNFATDRIDDNTLVLKDSAKFSVINRILKIFQGYTDTNIRYESANSPWHYQSGDVHSMTCSDWCMLALFGIDVESTKWNGNTNLVANGFDVFKEIYKYKCGNDFYSAQIAKYIDDNGLSYTPNADMSNVRPGDILFFDINADNDTDETYYPHTGETAERYLGIDHCAVFLYMPSPEFYDIIDISGSEDNNHGYVGWRRIEIDRWDVKTALRPITFCDYKPRLLAMRTGEVGIQTYKVDIDLDFAIEKNRVFTVVVDATRIDDSFLAIQGKRLGDSTYTTLLSESTLYTNPAATIRSRKAVFVVSDTNPITSVRVIAYNNGSGTRAMLVNSIKIYDGYCE